MSELHGLQLREKEIEASGAKLVAICVDPVEKNREVAERLSLGFPILSDPDLVAIDAFGLRHAAGDPFKSARPDGDIAHPATYLIEGGVVRWRDLTDNYRVRTDSQRVVDAVVAGN